MVEMPNKIAGDLGLMDLGRPVRYTDSEGESVEGTIGYISFDIGEDAGSSIRISIDTELYWPDDIVDIKVGPFTPIEFVDPQFDEAEEDYVDEHHPSNPSALGWV
jgi:hypothetical protein